MEMIAVQSSQIAAVGHDAAASLLRIQFRRGELYEYENVPLNLYSELTAASSVGTVFSRVIKGNPQHPARKITVPQERTVVLDPVVDISGPSIASNAQVQNVAEESHELADQAKAMRVTDAASQEEASGMLRVIAVMRGKIVATWKPMKEAAFRAHKTICEKEKEVDGPLLEAETLLKREIGGYIAAERERARQEEERLRAAEQGRADAEAKAESERLAIDDAIQLESEGQHEAAAACLAAPLPIAPRYNPPPPVVPQVARVSGVSTREVWKYRVVDEKLIPRHFLIVDEKAIGGVVRAMGAKTSIPGVEVYADTTVAASRR